MLVVEPARQVRSIKHSYFAADDRLDHRETDRLGAHLSVAEDRERAARPTSDADARSKLLTAARAAWRGNDIALALAIVDITRSQRGARPSLEGLIALRALCPLAAADERTSLPLQFATEWWSRPRSLLLGP